MAVKTKSKKSSKSNSRFRQFIQNFDPKSRKGMLMLFLFSFALVGGGYAAYRALAATYPPTQFRKWVSIPSVKAADGYTGTVSCVSAAGVTGYGALSNCLQYKAEAATCDDAQARTGLYSPSGKSFNTPGPWLRVECGKGGYDPNFGLPAIKCRNMNYYFVGGSALTTYFGQFKYGQIYKSYINPDTKKTQWQIKWADFSVVNGNCYPRDPWLNVVSFDGSLTN